MSMAVALACEAAPGGENEDFALALPGLVVVLDGITTPPGVATGCNHGTAWYVRRLAVQLAQVHTAEPEAPVDELVAEGISLVRGDHDGCDLAHPGTPSSTLCLLRMGDGTADFAVLSDSPLVLDRSGDVEVITDHRLKRTSERERSAVKSVPVGSPEHGTRVRALTEAQIPYRNQPGGYWIAGADPEAGRHAVTGTVPLTGSSRLSRAALLTDGAARGVELFGGLDWAALLDRLDAAGPAALISDVRKRELGDPCGRRWPRGKVHDDATAAYCTFSEVPSNG
jgi:hypothetical protein